MGEEWWMGSLMLAAAVMAAMALGVLAAYGVCGLVFQVIRVHATAVAKGRVGGVVRVAKSL